MDADGPPLELYKLEYEKAAERYENIYRSMWTIFSYLTAVTAGLLAFGSERIEWHGLICIAAIPLLFWFWTTYLPLDRYGNRAVKRLRKLERLLNQRYGTQLAHFTGFAHDLSLVKGLKRALKARKCRKLWRQVNRARSAIWLRSARRCPGQASRKHGEEKWCLGSAGPSVRRRARRRVCRVIGFPAVERHLG